MTQSDISLTGRDQLVPLLETAIVRITLGVLFLVPLVFPIAQEGHPFSELKVLVLHLGMLLVAVLWLWQLVLKSRTGDRGSEAAESIRILTWLGRNPARWAVLAMVVMWLGQAISTSLSPLPAISFFGSDEQFAGNNLYDSFALLVVFLVIAVKFRTGERLEQAAWVLIGSATIAAAYGIAQHFGWDPLGGRTSGRVLASFGNTINFSAYLGMSLPVTIAISLRKSGADRKLLVLLGLALALQLAGMWFSDSRGPFVGAASALTLLFAGIALIRSRSDLVQSAVVLGIGVLGAILLTLLPASPQSQRVPAVLSIGSEISNIGTGATSTDSGRGLQTRFQLWRNTLDIARNWDFPGEESGVVSIARPVFGLGSEMLPYSYPLAGDPHPDLYFTAHPHNYALQVLIGQGWLGLLLLVSSTLLILSAAWFAIRRLRSATDQPPAIDWILIAFSAALIGKIVESQVGVARVSDLTMTFALAGGIVAVSELVNRSFPAEFQETRSTTSGIAISRQSVFGLAIAGAVVSTILASYLIVSWDVRRFSASLDITFAPRAADGTVGLSGLVGAQENAPERKKFTFQLANFYFIAGRNAWQDGRADDAHGLVFAARGLLVEFEKRNPYERETQLALAKTSSTLVDWGFTRYSDEMQARYLKLAELFPTYPSLVSTSATALAKIGDNAMAIELAERAIATESSTKPWAVAWYAKGAALINMNSFDEAIEAFSTAIEKEPESGSARLAHGALAFIYRQRGETELAELHTKEAGG